MTDICKVCGCSFTEPSFGGPGICPACDCGIPPQVTHLRSEVATLRTRLATAERERDEARADAIRYRWLRDTKRLFLGPVVGANKRESGQRYILSSVSIGGAPPTTETLDAAIDAAIAGGQEGR